MSQSDSTHPDPGFLLENLGATAWFADETKVLRYLNRAARETRDGIRSALGRNVEECHRKPESVEKIRELYTRWRGGATDTHLYSREIEGGRAHNLLIPVHGPDGFSGVVELAFTTIDR